MGCSRTFFYILFCLLNRLLGDCHGARTLLRAAVSGLFRPSQEDLRRAARTLAGHHSKSGLPLQATAIMSWQCTACKQWAKATAAFCPQCGTARYNYAGTGSGAPWSAEPDYGEDDASWWTRRRPKSPRSRPSQSPRPRGKGGQPPGKQKGKPKGGRGPKEKPPRSEQPKPPKLEALPTAPEATMVQPPRPTGGAAPSSSSSGQDPLLRALLAHVASQDNVPEELASLVRQHSEDSHRVQSRQMHKMVARQQEAKRSLVKVRLERQAYETAWGQYLGQIAQLLETQLAERTKALASYDASEETWKTQLDEASVELAKQASQTADKALAMEVQEISEDEMDAREQQVHEAIAEEAKAAQARQQREQADLKAAELLTAMQQMRQSLPEKAREGSRTPRRSGSKDRETESGKVETAGFPGCGLEGVTVESHSICFEDDYVGVWRASFLALQLHHELIFEDLGHLLTWDVDPRLQTARCWGAETVSDSVQWDVFLPVGPDSGGCGRQLDCSATRRIESSGMGIDVRMGPKPSLSPPIEDSSSGDGPGDL
ncbi:clpB [Symbiodinium sp. CCMP2592]|nr:clpB [Symbiodinium sp. CCMP2592]